jgi:hypothetical protein
MNDVGANDFVVLMLESAALSCFVRISTEVAMQLPFIALSAKKLR